jgi:hypothetical protein
VAITVFAAVTIATGVVAPAAAQAATQGDIVNLANANIGGMACNTNSLGGRGFYSSCTGNGGQPEYWCADFAKWVWANSGVSDVAGLTPAARSFYTYGQSHGGVKGSPSPGDAVVFSNNKGDTSAGSGGIHHVAIVTVVNSNGTIETVSGDWNGESGSEAHFASTSHVIHNTPAYGSGVGTYSSVMGMWIEGFITAPGVTGGGGGDPISGAASYQWGDQELVFTPSTDGTLHHWYWISGQGTRSDDWGGGPIVGKTTGFAWNDQEHVFARGANNHLLHWWWTANDGQMHYADWGGEAYSDPTAFVWNGQQHIFAKAADGNLFHWYWDPSDGNLHTVKWSGAPAAFVGNPSAFAWDNQQHVVARGPNNTLYHWWWDQSTGTVSFADWGGQAYSDPTTFVWNGQQHYFAKAADGQLFHWFWDPGDRQVHTVEWGGAPGTFVGAPFGYKFRNQQHVVARGPDNKLYHWWWAQDTGTVSFANWGGEAYSDPTAFVYNNEQQQIFTQSATNTLYHYYWLWSDGNLHQDNWGGSVKYPNQ